MDTIEARPLEGWGYTYYDVTGSSSTMSTLMAPPKGAAKVKKFVTASPLHVSYNSRLPIVVYAPKGYEVRYRIWKASEITTKAEKG
jgi:ecotin